MQSVVLKNLVKDLLLNPFLAKYLFFSPQKILESIQFFDVSWDIEREHWCEISELNSPHLMRQSV